MGGTTATHPLRLIHLWPFCVVLLGHQHVRKVQKSGQKGELSFLIIIFANCGPAARDPECILAWAFLFCLIHKNTTTIPEGAEIELGVVESWFLHTRLSTKVNQHKPQIALETNLLVCRLLKQPLGDTLHQHLHRSPTLRLETRTPYS